MTISLTPGALSPAEGPIPDPLPGLIWKRSDLLSWGETCTTRSGAYRKRWTYTAPSPTNPDGVLFSLTCPDGTELGPFGCESAVDLQILKRERETCLKS